jgi:hypothetical protein
VLYSVFCVAYFVPCFLLILNTVFVRLNTVFVRRVWYAPVAGSGVRGHAGERTEGPGGGGGGSSAVREQAGGDGVGRGEEEDLESVVVDARSIFEMLQDQSTQQQAEIVKSYKLLPQKSQSSSAG